ncbi:MULTISPECIES: hypothetical protein [unclassified Nocardioides]|uniref:hypothetical protein n=1 Tax=unclassified Nocardioides TaxID=2615069 RepID=UPI00005707A6|nr:MULTISPECIES: hypothetical protein [unclassified Nocardioides]ABL84148.1 hypothetical protein Noca_4653 [Nocardioides sp. JS614]
MSEALSEARRASAAIFGNEKVVEVVLQLNDLAPTHAQALAAKLGVAHNLVRAVLLKLHEAGVILALPRTGRRSALYYDLPGEPDRETWNRLVHLCRALANGSAETEEPSESTRSSA